MSVSNKVRFAGISIVGTEKDHTIHLHTTARGAPEKLGVWVSPPMDVTVKMIELPRPMDRIEAAEYLLENQKGFKNAEIRKYLTAKISRLKYRQEQKRAAAE